MAVCACDTCDCIITLEPTLPDGTICDWCESDKHGQPLPITTEAGAALTVTTHEGRIVLEAWRGSQVRRRLILDRDNATRLAHELDLAIIGGGAK